MILSLDTIDHIIQIDQLPVEYDIVSLQPNTPPS